MTEYRFKVVHQEAYDDEPERWRVTLPHQCDAWEITEGLDGDLHAKAIASLELFITEARAALTDLRAEKEHGLD